MTSAEDYLAIQQILARNCWAMDENNFDALLENCTDDVVFDTWVGSLSGHAMREGGERVNSMPERKGFSHWVTNLVVDVDESGQRAKAKSYVQGIVADEETGYIDIRHVARYLDDLVKVDGAWKISYRKVEPWTEELGKRFGLAGVKRQ